MFLRLGRRRRSCSRSITPSTASCDSSPTTRCLPMVLVSSRLPSFTSASTSRRRSPCMPCSAGRRGRSFICLSTSRCRTPHRRGSYPRQLDLRASASRRAETGILDGMASPLTGARMTGSRSLAPHTSAPSALTISMAFQLAASRSIRPSLELLRSSRTSRTSTSRLRQMDPTRSPSTPCSRGRASQVPSAS